MEFSVPGFIKRYCTPNAMMTLTEYLVDYGTPEQKVKGFKLIEKNLHQLNGHQNAEEVRKRIDKIIAGERDLYF